MKTSSKSIITSYFHDGSILDIQQQNSLLKFFIESAEVPPDEHVGPLSKNRTLQGVVILKDVESISVNHQPQTQIRMFGDDGTIIRFKMTSTELDLFIEWSNYPPKPTEEFYSSIMVKARSVYWRNKQTDECTGFKFEDYDDTAHH